jgi:hypothetical protein
MVLRGLSSSVSAPFHPASFEHPVADTPFVQEYHQPYPIGVSAAVNDVRTILVDQSDRVWAATRAGVYRLEDGSWQRVLGVTGGPTYALAENGQLEIWVGAWNGLYRVAEGRGERIAAVDGPVTSLGRSADGLIALGPDGSWVRRAGAWSDLPTRWSKDVRDVAFHPTAGLWIATGSGLYHERHESSRLLFRAEELVSSEVTAVAFGPGDRVWIGSVGGLDVYDGQRRLAGLTGAQGLPHHDIRSLTVAPNGTLWVGTALGVARFDGVQWSLRHSRRWLLDDDVREVAFGADGTAWVATRSGVSAIRSRSMTLAEKADDYHSVCRKRHVRPPGLVEKCRFPDPADMSRWVPVDDDNDGQYTSMYLAMESFRFAVTGDPLARAYADEAFDALEFLQTVTGTSGFVARTVVPATWTQMADANEQVSPEEAVERRIRDPRYKVVEERWRKSADGQWLWKGDTSSDEITGHMFGYLWYHELAADPARKTRVRRLVGRIIDGIIEAGYELRDTDGGATRWGVWSPEKLNHDPDWRVERPINSFEMLSFLRMAHHLTGEARYEVEFRKLVEQHGYAENARRPKAYGVAERTHIDDELLALAGPGLLLYEPQTDLRARLMLGYAWAYHTVEREQNPFFNFIFGLLGGGDFHLAESVTFLRDTPLDLRQWTVDNSGRADVDLVRHPMLEPLQLNRMLPASERGVMRWDKNPWAAISGDFNDPEGRLESSGVFWLLPYWMGRYAGYIAAPDPGH